jgi:hypothetical protein
MSRAYREKPARSGGLGASGARRPESKALARKFGPQEPQGMFIVDVVPLGHGDDRKIDLTRALEGEAMHLPRAPRDVGEEPRVRVREPNQRIAAVERRAEHGDVALPNRADRGAKD